MVQYIPWALLLYQTLLLYFLINSSHLVSFVYLMTSTHHLPNQNCCLHRQLLTFRFVNFAPPPRPVITNILMVPGIKQNILSINIFFSFHHTLASPLFDVEQFVTRFLFLATHLILSQTNVYQLQCNRSNSEIYCLLYFPEFDFVKMKSK